MADFEVGDTVKVTRIYVGEVLGRGDASVRLAGHGWFDADLDDEMTVEVVEKRKPKVGDVFKSREDLFKLPPNSVAVNHHGYPLIVTSSTTLLTREGSTVKAADRVFTASPYTIIYIPDLVW